MKTFKNKLYYLLLFKILPFSCFLILQNTLMQLNLITLPLKKGKKTKLSEDLKALSMVMDS